MVKDCGDGGCGGKVLGLNPNLCCWFDCVGFVNCSGRAGLLGKKVPSIFAPKIQEIDGFYEPW